MSYKVVYINNDNVSLTIGKIYVTHRFITLKEYRKLKLEKINSNGICI